jgi:hypothetical protein
MIRATALLMLLVAAAAGVVGASAPVEPRDGEKTLAVILPRSSESSHLQATKREDKQGFIHFLAKFFYHFNSLVSIRLPTSPLMMRRFIVALTESTNISRRNNMTI